LKTRDASASDQGEGRFEIGRRGHSPDGTAPGSPARLERDRVADSLRLGERGIHGVGRRLAPRDYRDAGPARRGASRRSCRPGAASNRCRTDDRHSEPLAQLGELGPLRDEPPPGPDCVRLRLDQPPLESTVVEIGRPPQPIGLVHVGRRTEADGLVGFAHEPRMPVGFGEQGDDADAGPVFQVVLADRVDEPHGGFAAVHDRDATEVSQHACLDGGPAGAASRTVQGEGGYSSPSGWTGSGRKALVHQDLVGPLDEEGSQRATASNPWRS